MLHEDFPLVQRFVSDLGRHWKKRPFVWTEEPERSDPRLELPRKARVLVLGPHPDDPESVAITLRLLLRSECDLRYAIVTLSPSGVQDEDAGPAGHLGVNALDERKIAIRMREQILAGAALGLAEERIHFLRLGERAASVPQHSREDSARIHRILESTMPDIVILPAGKDSNRTHAWVHRIFRGHARRNAKMRRRPLVALYNEDPKTSSMRTDLLVLFGEQSAQWKRAVLRIHDSQQKRNLRLRQTGFDERILRVNRRRFMQFSGSQDPDLSSAGYAEAFEIERFGFS
jgi:LmbE family N-acetylglucosaminyl deacetylase